MARGDALLAHHDHIKSHLNLMAITSARSRDAVSNASRFGGRQPRNVRRFNSGRLRMADAIFGRDADRLLARQVIRSVALSYITSALLLLGFALAGTIRLWLPFAYAGAGLLECGVFYYLTDQPSKIIDGYDYLIPERLILSTAMQLLFMALAPQIAFYFLTMLFVVYALGSVGISARQAAFTWLGVAIVTSWLFLHNRTGGVPHSTFAERALVWLSFIVTLGRCVMLGVFGRLLRIRLQKRTHQLGETVAALKQRDQSLERVNAELLHQASHDSLTGLANRVLFAERLKEAVSQQRPFAVCVLDLDRFKLINDSLGHGAGDALLKLVARRLLGVIRSDDAVARAGGDEFLLLLRDVSSLEEIERLVNRWIESLAESCRLQENELHVSSSIGIARFPVDGGTGEDLLARADEAMYHAKQNGRNTYRFFDAGAMGFTRERLTIEADLRHAVSSGQFELHYQPKIDIASGEIRSVEALLRWQHPVRGRMMPGEFISIAEDTGLILPIGDWVIREACRQTRHWQLQGLPFLRVAVNVSPMQFRQSNFLHVVSEALSSNSLDPSSLEIELTEATLMSNAEKSVSMLERLSQLGVVVSIDDFGTGYSSMSYLQRFPIDKLKIDRSFIRDLNSNPDDASIVRAIISLAHGLRLKVVAEGVESAGQLELLKRMGCDQYQGFLRSPAVPASEVEALLTENQALVRAMAHPGMDRTYGKLARLLHNA
jgi:diguanylate cyclase (GGDEF)-like protein